MKFIPLLFLRFLCSAALVTAQTEEESEDDFDDFFDKLDTEDAFPLDDAFLEDGKQTIDEIIGDLLPYEFVTLRQSYQLQGNTSEEDGGLLNPEQLSFHAEVLSVVAQVQVEMFGVNWTMADFCFKPSLPKPTGKLAEIVFRIIGRTLPCTIVSPLDCFLEGSFVHGPYPPIDLGAVATLLGDNIPRELDWTTFDPQSLLAVLGGIANNLGNEELNSTINGISDVFDQMGITSGYSAKLCLDPTHPRCPASAPNKNNASVEVDTGSFLAQGCSGIVETFMQWDPKLFLDGFSKTSPEGPLTGVGELITNIMFSNTSDIHAKYTEDPGAKPGLDEKEWKKLGVAAAEDVFSLWADESFSALQAFAHSSGFERAALDVVPNEEWLAASQLPEKVSAAALDIAAGFEQAFADYSKLLGIAGKGKKP